MSLIRVGSLVHRYSPGNYTLEIVLGGLSSTFGIPWPSDEPPSAVVEDVPICPAGEVLAWTAAGGYICVPEEEHWPDEPPPTKWGEDWW